jgi:hypothetical protein
MARRTRSFLIDGTLNRIFSNTDAPVNATPANLIAGAKITQRSFTSGVTVAPVSLLTNFFTFPSSAVATSITVTATIAPVGGTGITVVVKKGTTASNATPILTAVLPSGQTSATTLADFAIAAGERLYFGITTVGTVKPGKALAVLFNYYSN